MADTAVQLVQEVLTGRGTAVLGLLPPERDRFLRLSDSSRRLQGDVQLTGSDDDDDDVVLVALTTMLTP